MKPGQLDILQNGAFIYEAADGRPFASLDYKLQEYGVKLLRRAGPMTEADLQGDVATYLAKTVKALSLPSMTPTLIRLDM